jgi:hypothetical protein
VEHFSTVHGAPFARPLLEKMRRLYGLHLIAWIHMTLDSVAVIPWHAKRQKNRRCLSPQLDC